MTEKYVVLTETALMQICHAALEAFCIKHLTQKGKSNPRKKKYVETCGLLWGNLTKLPITASHSKLIYTITQATIETSASRNTDEVAPDDDSIFLKRDLMSSFWPQNKFLGDFHTHPYRKTKAHFSEIEKEKLYEFSDADISSIEDDVTFWAKHNYRIGLVVTVVDMDRRSEKIEQKNNSTVVFNFGNYRIWIKAYYAKYFDDRTSIKLDDKIKLRCPSLLGLEEYTVFGRHQNGNHIEGDFGDFTE
ncbi:MAG: hypothetical protein J7L46_06070 [Bacteroidales bacterium]|jgi:hypothetical protein|nr:hypothetical protein [Bacteroidales bacterium]